MVLNDDLSKPARLLLLVSLLARDRLISHNGKGFLKELILRRDPDVIEVFAGFGSHPDFLEQVNELIDRESGRLFDELFADCSLSEGKSLSKAERRRKGLLGDKGLIYGEVEFLSFAAVLREVMVRMPSDPGKVFYDLGSGTGKAVYVARLTQDFSHCVGIELLEPLHSAAQCVTDLYHAKFRQCLDSTRPQNAAVYLGSFLEFDWSDGDVVFANSTCFPDGLMERLTNQAEGLKPGAIVVTFTKMLESSCFDLLEKRRFDMSWGPATVFIQRRRPRGDTPSRTPPPMSSSNAPRGAISSADMGDGASSGIRRIEREWHGGSPGREFQNDQGSGIVGVTGTSTGREFQNGQGRTRGSEMAVGSFGRQEAGGDAQEVSPDKGVLLFDAKQGVKVQGGDRNGTAPMNKRFMEFRELLKIAEQTQQEVFERLRISREELMALPDDLETDCLGDLDANRNGETSGMQGGGEQRYNRETGVFRSDDSIVGGIGRGGDTSSRSGRGNNLGSIGVSVIGRGAAASPDDAGGCCDRESHPPFFSEKYASLAGKTTEEAPAAASLATAAVVKEGAGGSVDASNSSGRRVGVMLEVGDDNTDPRVVNAAYHEGVEGAGSVIFAFEENVDKGVKVSEDRSQVVAGLGEEGKPLGTNAAGSENMWNKEELLGGKDGADLVLLACEADDALAETLSTGDINGGERGACGDSYQTRLPGTPLVVVREGGTRMLSIDTAEVSAGGKECSREQPHQACTLSSAGAASSSTSYPPCRDYEDNSHGDRADALSHESRCCDRADDVDPGSDVVLPPPPTLPGALSSNSSVGRNNDSAGQVPQLPLPPVDVFDDNSEAVPEVGT